MLPPSPMIVSSDWNSLDESHLPSSSPFQISVEVNSYTIHLCVVDEGAYVSILSLHAWKGLGSPNLTSVVSQLLNFNRRPSEPLGFLPQFPISLSGKTILVDVIVMEGPLYFSILLRHD
jgi:hypothetical protein